MNTDGVVLVALSDVDDATFCCASEVGFEPTDLPLEAFYRRHSGGVFCDVSGTRRFPNCRESPTLEVD